jgi:signal transduction histidine kinase
LIKQGVKINLNLDHELPHIKSDKDKLNQVFSNLIINAMEAMPRGGEITISSELNGEEKVNVTFSDTGIGIPQEDIRNRKILEMCSAPTIRLKNTVLDWVCPSHTVLSTSITEKSQ